MLLDEFLPAFQFNEVHKVQVCASSEKTFAAIKELSWGELSPIVNLLLGIRSLPSRLASHGEPRIDSRQPMLTGMYQSGFIPLAESPNEIVFGLIGQFWKLKDDAPPPIHSPQEFLAFADPAFAKVAANLQVCPSASGQVECKTETRIHVPDPNTRKKFALYWWIISMGSALIRILWLNAIKHRAER